MVSNHNSANDIQNIVGEAILQQLPHIELRKGTKYDDVRIAIRVFMRKHPEIFWFSHQYRFNESTSTLSLKYNFTPRKKDFFSKEIDNAVHLLFQPDKLKNLSDSEKVAYVYKWLVNNTTYNEYSSFNQTIYSVLINRNSVCTGYAKTAQYLLGIIGIESELVFGKFHADKSDDGRHGWNIVKIDGDWYHIDFCLADPSLKHLLNLDETPVEYDGLLWNYFCKPTEYVLRNRSIEFVDSYPECVKSIDKRFTLKLAKAQERAVVCRSDSGSSAKVYIDSFDKDSVIKKTRTNPHLIDNEAIMLQRLKGCKHIVKLKGLTDDGIVIEQLTPWGELLNSHYYHPNESQLKDLLIQLTEGLIECREKGITYSDIHYNNVFVTKDGIYKWGDFGIAFPSAPEGHLPTQMIGADGKALGSRWFMPPETYRERIFTESSAIYSLAMLAYFVMNDMRPPFLSGDLPEQEALQIKFSGSTIPSPVGSFSFGLLSQLIRDVLNANAATRQNSYEAFISLLKSCDENEITFAPSQDDEIVIIDNNSACYSEIVTNNNLDWALIDPDNLARTIVGEISNRESFETDSDDFATTIISPNSNQRDDGFYHNTDSYAQTLGFIPAPVPPAASIRSARTPVGGPNTTSTTTSFYPGKGKIKSDDQFHSKNLGTDSVVGSTLNIIGGFLTDLAERIAYSPIDLNNRKDETDEINTCLYAPAEVSPKKSFIIRVYMYLPNEQETVDAKIKEIDPQAVKKEYKPLDLPVKKGDKLTVQLDLSDGVVCKNTSKTIVWKGHYADCSFMAKLVDVNQDSVDGTAYVFVNDIPAGEMLFTIDVVDSQPRKLYTKVESHRFSKIFISYAHQDESQVRGIAECCRMLGKDYFFDRHSLQPGDIFKDKILDYINTADLFVLCWSKNAAESVWVQIEREHALRLIREGKSSLSIYPLCLRPEAPLPIDMSDKYNFGTL